jgi:predicted nuclease with TOPRIM domain
MIKGESMKQQLEKRLAALKAEYESGQKMLADLEKKHGELEATLLRISGAIQVIEEMLQQEVARAEKSA